jgi:hypothetical protein
MTVLGCGLSSVRLIDEAANVYETAVSMFRRFRPHDRGQMRLIKHNLARCYLDIGRVDEALAIFVELHSEAAVDDGPSHPHTLSAAVAVVTMQNNVQRYAAALSFSREHDLISLCDRVLGSTNGATMKFRLIYAMASFHEAAAPPVSRGDMANALADMEELGRTTRRVLGDANPQTIEVQFSIARHRKIFEALSGAREPVATNPEA